MIEAGLTPLAVDHAIKKCLAKAPDERWQSASDLASELKWIAESDSRTGASAPAIRGGRMPWVYAGVAIAVVLILAGLVWRQSRMLEPTRPVVRFTLAIPASEPVAANMGPALAFSPDGRRIGYVVNRHDTTQLYIRELASFEGRILQGTEGASQPFFSPGGEWLGFYADEKLKKISVAGGPAIVLCEAPEGNGATWLPDDTIVFNADWREGLRRVSAGGGTASLITRPDERHGEAYHWWPDALPGGKALLFTDQKGPSRAEASIAVLSLKNGDWKTVIDKGTSPHYLAGGRILYEHDGAFLVAPFDVEKLAVTGPSVAVLQGVLLDLDFADSHLAVSREGSVAYVPGATRPLENMLVTVDRSGHESLLTSLRRPWEDLTLSPDGRFLALTLRGDPQWNVWLYEMRRGSLSRITFEGDNRDPIWTPDGKRVVYESFRNGRYGIFWKPIIGPGAEEELLATGWSPWPFSFSRDDRWFSYTLENPSAAEAGIYMLPLQGDRKPQHIVAQPYARGGVISPDGKWIAYESRETGRSEAYVKELSSGASKWQVSSEGGVRPRWSTDGRELFFRSGSMRGDSTLMAVAVQTEGGFAASLPRPLFRFRYAQAGHDYAVMPDDQHFICIKESERDTSATQVNVILNWSAELEKR